MLHVLLTILKILGILLLIILGIVLFLILAVLFVPFRYSVTGEKHKAEKLDDETQVIKAKVVVSWLVHIVHFRFRLRTKESDEVSSKDSNKNVDKESKIKTDMELFLFGIPVFTLKNKISENSKKSKRNTNSKEQVEIQASSELNMDVTGESITQDVFQENEPDDLENSGDSELKEVTEVLEDDFTQSDNSFEVNDTMGEPEADTQKEKINPIKKLFQKVKEIPEKIKATIENIKLTIKKLYGKIKAGSDFLKKESTKATIRLLLGKLKNIIMHILPKKLKGNLIFGFEDPALTGEVLGLASLFYPKYQKTLKLIPVFEQQILEGKLQIKGRIVVAYIVWQAIKIVLSKSARLTFKNVKKLVAELKQ